MAQITWPVAFMVVGCAFAFALLCRWMVYGMREEYTVTTTHPTPAPTTTTTRTTAAGCQHKKPADFQGPCRACGA